jgi:hypothetical protein
MQWQRGTARLSYIFVIPAEAGIHSLLYSVNSWNPVCTGMKGLGVIQ